MAEWFCTHGIDFRYYCMRCEKQEGIGRVKQAARAMEMIAANWPESKGVNSPEPPPQKTEGRPIWELVIADMQERDKHGEAKYGTRLQAFNGRSALTDAYQEALDLCVYLRQKIEEEKNR